MTIGLLHPGAMGASVGACAAAAGHPVSWVSTGRSSNTRARADAAGLKACDSLAELTAEATLIISLCPPAAARATATAVLASGFDGIYVDANAIAPTTATEIALAVEAAGAHYVDGGVIGPPALTAGTTRLCLSGDRADEVAACFRGSVLETIVLEAGGCAASALKMCYAAWSKGSSALLLAVAALAARSGVSTALQQEWQRSQPGLGEQLAADATRNAPKAWRFAGEMEEIAATFSAADMPPGFHTAAAAIYAALADFRDTAEPSPEAVIAALTAATSR